MRCLKDINKKWTEGLLQCYIVLPGAFAVLELSCTSAARVLSATFAALVLSGTSSMVRSLGLSCAPPRQRKPPPDAHSRIEREALPLEALQQ